ncbi:MAG: nucleotidyltransferase family protein, partial [Methylocella sp.]
ETKLAAPLFGKPLIRHAAEAALASRARPIFVVTGHAAPKVEAALVDLGFTLIVNPDYRTGLSSSLKAGIRALPETVAGAVILLADMPRISGELIDRLIETYETPAEPPLAVTPVCAGLIGNPVLIGRRLFDSVAHLEGDHGARRLIVSAGHAVLKCPVDDNAIAIDIDTKEALRSLEGRPYGRCDPAGV